MELSPLAGYERGERSIVGLLDIRREAARRKLLHPQMKVQTLAAFTVFGAAGISAGAFLVVFGKIVAVHVISPLKIALCFHHFRIKRVGRQT